MIEKRSGQLMYISNKSDKGGIEDRTVRACLMGHSRDSKGHLEPMKGGDTKYELKKKNNKYDFLMYKTVIKTCILPDINMEFPYLFLSPHHFPIFWIQ